MGLKSSPSIRDYWKRDSFWQCGLIPNVFTQDRFESLLRCLHCVNNFKECIDKMDPRYDKIYKVQWMLQHFVKVSNELYNP